jgi:uncharacterized damage-inducible protein DinB
MSLFDHDYPTPENLSPRLQDAVRQIEFARGYTKVSLEGLTDDDWYWSPQEMTTHIAWQVGHLAMAQYGLTLFMQRGRAEIDSELMSGKFRKRFMKGTMPTRNREDYPEVAEILQVLDRVHDQMRTEIANFDGDHLDQPASAPHAAYATNLGSLLFASKHEMMHAGQIGMLRRLMGKEPMR